MGAKHKTSAPRKRSARAASVLRDLRRHANAVKARALMGFFKTGKDQYGEGDRFLGIMVPQTRAVANSHAGAATLEDIAALLESVWHEARLCALLMLVWRYQRSRTRPEKHRIVEFYWGHTNRVNNWDLVDISAHKIVGEFLYESGEIRDNPLLTARAQSPLLWDRRIAVLTTFAFIKHGEFDEALRLATLLLQDPHDLMHKAVGWMLREVGKQDAQVLRAFLGRHAAAMARTTLRYAIERFPAAERAEWLAT